MRIVWVIALVLGALCAPVRAGSPKDKGDEHGQRERMERIRELYAKADYEGVRTELLAAYDEAPEPALLFALGQVELNLGNYKSAIEYYEKFIATRPADDQVALAQQGIGAARFRLSEPEREPSPPTPLEPTVPVVRAGHETPEEPPPPKKRWTVTHTGFVAFGSAAVLLGAGLLYYSHSLGNDRSGSLMDYDHRLAQARTTRWTGIGIAAAGTLIIGVTLAW
jgi:tetratricopeptide (TPR) repeat protein